MIGSSIMRKLNLLSLFAKKFILKKKIAIIISFLLSFFFIGSASARKIQSKRECAVCHISWVDDFAIEDLHVFPDRDIKATGIMIEGRMGVVSTEEVCYTCHDGGVLDSRKRVWPNHGHPVYVKPREVKVPSYFPLNKDGEIYCGTCHSAHGVNWRDFGGMQNKPFLRYENINSFLCKLCHADKKTGRAGGNHPINKNTYTIPDAIYKNYGKSGIEKDQVICESCHSVHGARRPRLTVLPIDKAQLCGTCHADRYTKSFEESTAKRTHPVNIIPRKVRLSPALLKAGGHKGPKGEIICLSCHKIHRSVPGTKALIKKNVKSGLCMECHKSNKTVLITKHNLSKTQPGTKNANGETADESGPCGVCHFPHRGKGAKMWARKIDRSRGPDEISNLCLSCHAPNKAGKKKVVGKKSHPLAANIKNAEGHTSLPLYTKEGVKDKHNGNVTCASCHNLHQWNPVDKKDEGFKEGDASNSFLRKNNVRSGLCGDCHTNKMLVKGTDHDLSITAPGEKNMYGQTVASSGVCSPCHMVHNAKTKVKIWARKLAKGADGIEKRCKSCHSEGNPAHTKQLGNFSHPVKADIGKVGGKTDLPLFDEAGRKSKTGKVTCASCHDLHQWNAMYKKRGPGKKVEGDLSNSFLRIPNDKGSKLCINCHGDKATVFDTKHDMTFIKPSLKNAQGANAQASGACMACHTPHNAQSYRLWNRKIGPGDDPISPLCKSCHLEGKIAKTKQINENSHPVGKSIKGADGHTDLPTYTADAKLAKDGLVYCSSCHNVHQWNPAKAVRGDRKKVEGTTENSFLRVSNTPTGTELCASCHKSKVNVLGTKHDLRLSAPNAKNDQGNNVKKSGVCFACHMVHNAKEKIRLWNRSLGSGDDPIAKRCRSCHAKDQIAAKKQIGSHTHPFNKSIKGADGDTDFPTYDDDANKVKRGKIYCSSCHNVHQWDPQVDASGPGKMTEGNLKNSFLRDRALPGPNLCKHCHASKVFVVKTDHDLRLTAPDSKNILGQTPEESGVCGVCHIIHNGPNKLKMWARKFGPPYLSTFKDKYKLEKNGIVALCLSCHSEGNPAQAKQPKFGLHPPNIFIGERMTGAGLSTQPVYPFFKTDGSKATDGNITCPTCHNPHQWNAREYKQGPGKNTEGNVLNSFLRENLIFGLCTDCHSFDALYRVKYYHVDKRSWK